MTNFAPTILTAYLHQLDNWMKKTCYMSNKCLALSADFLDECVKYKATWQILKNHTDVLVAQFIFPLICFSSKDEQLWRGNAVEYVYKRIGKPTQVTHHPASLDIDSYTRYMGRIQYTSTKRHLLACSPSKKPQEANIYEYFKICQRCTEHN